MKVACIAFTWGTSMKLRIYGMDYSRGPETKIILLGIKKYEKNSLHICSRCSKFYLSTGCADGFCSWFILQYKRGYKPFVTMMSKEIEIEGRL